MMMTQSLSLSLSLSSPSPAAPGQDLISLRLLKSVDPLPGAPEN